MTIKEMIIKAIEETDESYLIEALENGENGIEINVYANEEFYVGYTM